ncbi:P-loop containing nucleoside triphosphate hydrolase [Trinorchestia longiramus]|nr:P-loop containing nucleoside triphosphate hydrolase [Trinorchestia longiramus]
MTLIPTPYTDYLPHTDITHIVQPEKASKASQQSLVGLPPALDGVWGRVLADSSVSKSYPKSLQKPLHELKEHLLTEMTGMTYQTLIKNYIAGKPLVLPSWPKPLQIVIVTTWRSGSTFTEQLFDSHPAVMDAYEPLSHLNLLRARGTNAHDGLAIVRDLLQCRWDLLGLAAVQVGLVGTCCSAGGTCWDLLRCRWDLLGPAAVQVGLVGTCCSAGGTCRDLLQCRWNLLGPAAVQVGLVGTCTCERVTGSSCPLL